MARLEDFAQFDFSGGIRTDKGVFDLQNNELQRGRNFDVDERGRIIKRRGSILYGYQSATLGTIDNGIVFFPSSAGSPKIDMLINNRASSGTVYTLNSEDIATALVAATSTSVTMQASNGLDAPSDFFEVEGDVISYSNRASTTYTISAATVTSNHSIGAQVNQWHANSAPASGTQDFSQGGYYCVLNNKLFINARQGSNNNTLVYFANPGDTTVTDVSGAPRILFATTFKDRIYGAGDGSDATNGRSNRVYFSNLADGTTWASPPTSQSFDIEDNKGPVTGLRVFHNRLYIFKNSAYYLFTGSLPVQQISGFIGAYNHRVIQEINGVMYVFGPLGVFATNGASTKNIGEPVKKYLTEFQPRLDSNFRVVTNTFAGVWNNKYFLYIGNVTTPETLSGVVLVYDTISNNWTVYDNFLDASCFINSSQFISTAVYQPNIKEALWYGNSNGYLYRCFDNRLLNNTTARGGDLFSDNFVDTGTPITMNVVTKPYDINTPNTQKQFKYVRIYSETAGIRVSCIIDDADPIALGYTVKGNDRLPFPAEAKGYHCALVFDESSTTGPVILNGFVFEETETITKNNAKP